MDEQLMTVDELARATGLTVRTSRYYATLGLIPPPVRRGRVAYYTPVHRARLELVRALQDHGFTLSAIERYLARLPDDTTVEDLAVHRAMLTSWRTAGPDVVSRRQLETRAGRRLDDEQVRRLEAMMAVRRVDDRFEITPAFDVAVKALDLAVPVESLVEAGEAINRHMDALADELTAILKEKVLAPYRGAPRSEAERDRFEQTMSGLRRLTLEAVVSGFQRAADQVIRRSLSR